MHSIMGEIYGVLNNTASSIGSRAPPSIHTLPQHALAIDQEPHDRVTTQYTLENTQASRQTHMICDEFTLQLSRPFLI